MNRRDALKNTTLFAGITLSSATISSLLQSCQQEPALDWEPQFFTPEQALSISAMVDIMLPRTETPGALDLKVDRFVDIMLAQAISPEDQEHVRKGYSDFENTTSEMYGKAFHSLTTEQQTEVLKKVAEQSNKFNPSIWGSTLNEEPPIDFFRRVKQFALMGYYTSQQIGTEVLSYDPIPGVFQGCIPVKDVGNAWTI